MSEFRRALTDMAERLFAELSGGDFISGWAKIREAGVASLLVSEEQGGFNGDLFAVMRLAGYHALALPLGETILAPYLLAKVGIDRLDGGFSILANCCRAPWGRDASALVSVADGEIFLYSTDQCSFEEGNSTAGEPRDRARFTSSPMASADCAVDFYALGAFL
jgi:acyl-CoA dehydrogenase